ncbi:Enoyl-(Acyl carrier protein) reductase [Ceratobasidium sp. AG-Ba]|nr:Enoyl-(Acyl carrier protein) reductase [Ceratobasidium sp. AG-Ba]
MTSSSTLLNGKKVLIVGGSSGIGLGVASAALGNGASVVIASTTQSKVNAAVELLKKAIEGKEDMTVSGETLDIRDFEALTAFLTRQAPFDHFITTAGEFPRRMAGSIDAGVDIREKFKDSMDIRYWASLNAANIIHKRYQRPFPGWGFVLGGVAAVETATRGLAVDLKPLRISSSSPGLVATNPPPNTPGLAERAKMLESFREKLLVGHIGTPDEVAEAYIFAMKYLTGQVITVDGGGLLV